MGSQVKELNRTAEEKQLQQKLDKEANFKWLGWSFVVFCAIAVIVLIIFIVANPWYFTWKADATQWGQFGDFIGGFVGTALVFLSIYYLIKTLRAQIEANNKVAENNEAIANVNLLQQTDTKIKHLLSFYKEVRDSYKEKLPGTKTLNDWVVLLKEYNIQSTENYATRLLASKEAFDRVFYIPCKPIAAVQFRVLYQIMCLIKTIDKKNNDIKLFYGKMVRSQLSEDELLLLRYNCQCIYGRAMREHINEYNLLKHLPPLSLLEFQYWSKNVINSEVLQNALDTELIAQRKEIMERTKHKREKLIEEQKGWNITSKYHVYMDFSDDNKTFTYCLTRRYSYPDSEHIDEAFSALADCHMYNFIKDYLHEVFEYSNFQIFNAGLDYDSPYQPEYNPDKEETKFVVVVKSLNDNEIVTNYQDYLDRNPEKSNNNLRLDAVPELIENEERK